jgi:hypothetical protein
MPLAIPLALAMPLPLAIPLPLGMPRPLVPPRFVVRDAGAGVENLEEFLEDAGGFSTNEVSVVLGRQLDRRHRAHVGLNLQKGGIHIVAVACAQSRHICAFVQGCPLE